MSSIKFYIIGTAKSQKQSQYYISERWKMWGILFHTGKIKAYWKNMDDFLQNANQEFAEKNHFKFIDLINETYALDSQIDFSNENTKNDIQKNTQANINSEVQNLIFNGKKALHTFLFGCTLIDVDFNSSIRLKKIIKECDYGKQHIKMDSFFSNDLLSKKNIYLAPNTSSTAKSYNEFHWIDILNDIK